METGTTFRPLPSFRNPIKLIKPPSFSSVMARAGNFTLLVQHFKIFWNIFLFFFSPQSRYYHKIILLNSLHFSTMVEEAIFNKNVQLKKKKSLSFSYPENFTLRGKAEKDYFCPSMETVLRLPSLTMVHMKIEPKSRDFLTSLNHINTLIFCYGSRLLLSLVFGKLTWKIHY